MCERGLDSELERLQTNIVSLTEERDQLQEIIQGLRDVKNQLKREMEEKDEMVSVWVFQLEPVLNINPYFTAGAWVFFNLMHRHSITL